MGVWERIYTYFLQQSLPLHDTSVSVNTLSVIRALQLRLQNYTLHSRL